MVKIFFKIRFIWKSLLVCGSKCVPGIFLKCFPPSFCKQRKFLLNTFFVQVISRIIWNCRNLWDTILSRLPGEAKLEVLFDRSVASFNYKCKTSSVLVVVKVFSFGWLQSHLGRRGKMFSLFAAQGFILKPLFSCSRKKTFVRGVRLVPTWASLIFFSFSLVMLTRNSEGIFYELMSCFAAEKNHVHNF